LVNITAQALCLYAFQTIRDVHTYNNFT